MKILDRALATSVALVPASEVGNPAMRTWLASLHREWRTPPWLDRPGRWVTLLEIVKVFRPARHFGFIGLLAYVDGATLGTVGREVGKEALPDAARNELKASLGETEQEFVALGLTASVATTRRMIALMDRAATFAELRDLGNELQGRLVDEMAGTLLLYVDGAKARFYTEKNLFGVLVGDHFPSATLDIEEAGKSLALSRATACVFHLMRVMEVGLRVLARTLNDPSLDPRNNPNWGVILSRCRAELAKSPTKRSAEWVADELFFAEATATLEAVKNAWRNPTMHVEIAYDDDKALDVWNSVGAFMRHLATRLKE